MTRRKSRFWISGLAFAFVLLFTVLPTLLSNSAVYADPPRERPTPLDIGVRIRGSAALTEGRVIITGQVTCNEPVEVKLYIKVAQEQANETPGSELVRGLEHTTVACTSETPTSFTLSVSPVGRDVFAKGWAMVDVIRALGCGEVDCNVTLLSTRVWVRQSAP